MIVVSSKSGQEVPRAHHLLEADDVGAEANATFGTQLQLAVPPLDAPMPGVPLAPRPGQNP
jgi:hypothetical protein